MFNRHKGLMVSNETRRKATNRLALITIAGTMLVFSVYFLLASNVAYADSEFDEAKVLQSAGYCAAAEAIVGDYKAKWPSIYPEVEVEEHLAYMSWWLGFIEGWANVPEEQADEVAGNAARELGRRDVKVDFMRTKLVPNCRNWMARFSAYLNDYDKPDS